MSNESPERQLTLAREQSLAKILSPETYGQNVPTPLKRHLFWPGTTVKTNKKRNKKDEKMPAVIRYQLEVAGNGRKEEKKINRVGKRGEEKEERGEEKRLKCLQVQKKNCLRCRGRLEM